jgi:hypothetical protein
MCEDAISNANLTNVLGVAQRLKLYVSYLEKIDNRKNSSTIEDFKIICRKIKEGRVHGSIVCIVYSRQSCVSVCLFVRLSVSRVFTMSSIITIF